ncbi:hypothetical protein JCM19236_1157 [Vibrio sp. JCM 19236]|nr:hypothetical protein JCM19236_1157 [Vibrio sp. JCM 19236]
MNALLTSAELKQVNECEGMHPLLAFNATLKAPMLEVLQVFKPSLASL